MVALGGQTAGLHRAAIQSGRARSRLCGRQWLDHKKYPPKIKFAFTELATGNLVPNSYGSAAISVDSTQGSIL